MCFDLLSPFQKPLALDAPEETHAVDLAPTRDLCDPRAIHSFIERDVRE